MQGPARLEQLGPPPWQGGPPLPPALAATLERLDQSGAAPELDRLRDALPATSCARQGACCGLLPPLMPLEMLVWLARLPARPARERQAQAAGLVEHFLLNAWQRRPCPWARPGACAIYGERFFACRAHGLWPPELYAPRREQALAASARVARAWQGLGIRLPAEVLAPPPPYCRQVKVVQGDPPSGQELARLEEAILAQGRELDPPGDLAQVGGDLGYLVAALALGPAACLRAKVEVTRHLARGAEPQAQAWVQEARAWAEQWASGLGERPPRPGALTRIFHDGGAG